MVYKIVFCSEFPNISDEDGRKREEGEEKHRQLKCIMRYAKAIIYFVLFDWTGNTIGETVRPQHLTQYITIYLRRECRITSSIRRFIMTTENSI